MFDPTRLALVLDLHERSFAFLKWVRDALQLGSLSFSVVHTTADSSTAAIEWIERHQANIPCHVRSPEDQIPTFARLFVAFLTTSYKLWPAKTRRVSDCGCYCNWCSYLRSAPSLESRTPAKKDFQTARELKRIYVGRLAEELRLENAATAVESVVNLAALHEQVAVATWSAELMRRSEFASQGEAVLALWREFAWQNHQPRKKFRLQLAAILAAEQDVCAALRAANSSTQLS
jgi:hypothetical protein